LRTIQRAGPNSADRWLADFLGQLQRDDLAPATVRGCRYDLRQFLRWFNHAKGPSARFEKLSAIDLINYRQRLLKVESLRQPPARSAAAVLLLGTAEQAAQD
jgi:hypothetical protein